MLPAFYSKVGHIGVLKELVGQILDSKLENIFPKDAKIDSFISLVEWDMWPLLISIHRKLKVWNNIV